ncbi:hypothetical protein R1sor_026444 [Riccia sorocarpa]|uniref:Bet v I/Major latex protein domain-containing protein n=1 Tax=Riccia sorocarpa TaxID=122646 RepID=A0ABD3GF26_9MARC
MPTFECEIELDVAAPSVWLALQEQDTIFPKILPECIVSIEQVAGAPGQPGSIRLIKFGPMKKKSLFSRAKVAAEGTFVKEKLVTLYDPGYTVTTEEVEGGHLAQGFSRWVSTTRVIPVASDRSRLNFATFYEGGTRRTEVEKAVKKAKEGIVKAVKELEEYMKITCNG